MQLLLARHGQSQWQVEGDAAGSDAPLTSLGELQAQRLGDYLARMYAVDAIFTSPLQRARRTAEIAAGYLDMPVTVEPDLSEFEDWDLGWAPLPASRWDVSPATPTLSFGYARYRARILAALQRIVESHLDGKTVLLVAHGGTLGAVFRILLGSDTPRLWLWNASLSLVEWGQRSRGESWILHLLNQMEYLPAFMRTS